jgi:RND family efflux transporter MFP subunit
MTERTVEHVAVNGRSDATRAAPLPTAEAGQRSFADRRVLFVGAGAAIILAGALTAGTLPRWRQQQAVDAAAAKVAAAPPKVTVAVAKRMSAEADRVLPGDALPLLDAAMYARTTGYVKSRLVDIGDRVKEGQLLAEITAPDVDAQLAQAKANLAQAQANLPLSQAQAELAKTTLKRDVDSGPGIGATLEQIDQDRAQVKVTEAQIEATRASIQVNQAMVDRFVVLQGFQKITAPFQGVITARNIDQGDLISADNLSSRQMFHIMRTDVIRVFVNVPQVFSTGIKLGQQAFVYLRDDPARQFPGKVTRTADALDPSTRTLLTEVDVPNPENALRPGMYLQVKFVFDRTAAPIMIPTAALAIRAGRTKVGVLDGENRVRYRQIKLGRDFGAEVVVIDGLNDGEKIVVHPGDDLADGTVVEPLSPKQ